MFSMRRLLVATGSLALVACDSGPTEVHDWTQKYVVYWEGTVTSSVDGAPVAGVSVELFNENADGSPQSRCTFACPLATTDSLGFYSVGFGGPKCSVGSPDPSFLQVCSDAGYGAPRHGCTDWQESQPVYVTSCEPDLQLNDFVLEPVPPSAAKGR